MKVLITKFPHNSLLGGGELHTLDLVKHLSKKGFDFELLSSDTILLDEFKKRSYAAQKMWAPLEPVSIKGLVMSSLFWPFFVISLALRIAKLKEKPKVLFCLSYTEKVFFTPFARVMGMKVVWMEHLRIERSYRLNPLRLLYVLYSRLATVVTVSKEVGRQLQKLGVPQKNIEVIYNGIDVDQFTPRLEPEKEVVTIGTMSRLVDEKAVDVVIEALSHMKEKVHVRIAGKGPKEKELKELVEEKGLKERVSFEGFVEPVQFLSELDIFALTPRAKESFGYAAAEAMAMKKPVIGTRISGLSEVIEDNETGELVKIDDEKALAEKLDSLVRDEKKRKKMGEAGRKRVEEMFTLKNMIDSFEKVFR